MDAESDFWKKCSNCKKPIGFSEPYFVCSVSTCNHERTGYQFCSVSCWSGHVPIMRHRDAWAVEAQSPSRESAQSAPSAKPVLYSRPAQTESRPAAPVVGNLSTQDIPIEVLVVVSKLKAYIKARGDMNTAAEVTDLLSEKLRRLCDQAILQARQDGRKTVMSRDF